MAGSLGGWAPPPCPGHPVSSASAHAAPALSLLFPTFSLQLPYFCGVVRGSPFRTLILELFWGDVRLLFWPSWLRAPISTAREWGAGESPRALCLNFPSRGPPPRHPIFNHIVTRLKDRTGELRACLLELERPLAQCPLHMSPVRPFASRQATPLPTVPALPPAKKFRE